MVIAPRWRIGEAHKNNCCAIHGCKWSEKDCPVVAGTKDAYMAACRALWKHREGEEKLLAANKALAKKNKELRNRIRLLKKRAAAHQRNITKHF
jgi:hypothetical protein